MVWNDLRNDTTVSKNKLMQNFEALQNGSASVYTTAQRLALTPTAGMLVYDSTLSTLFVYDGSFWVVVV